MQVSDVAVSLVGKKVSNCVKMFLSKGNQVDLRISRLELLSSFPRILTFFKESYSNL